MHHLKNPKLLAALGVFILAGSTVADRFFIPLNGLLNGFLKGLGIALVVFPLRRVSNKASY